MFQLFAAQQTPGQIKPVGVFKKATDKPQFPMPKMKDFGVYPFRRDSDNPDSSGIDQPPYKFVEIVNGSFGVEAKTSEKVTVIPLGTDFKSFEIKITKVSKADFIDCNAEPPGTVWDVEFEKVTRKEFLEAKTPRNRNPEVPFDVFVIYPSVKFARSLKASELTKSMLPKGVYKNTVTAAVDLTGDGKPDLLEASFCCNDSKVSAEKCDYTCGTIYKKIKNRWKAVRNLSSCT